MIGFGLLVGHMVGDYVLQSDWMAANKANPYHGDAPDWKRLPDGSPWYGTAGETLQEVRMWNAKRRAWLLGHLACTVHCLLYTLAVWACSWQWMPWWGLLACFLIHWPIDRFRLVRLAMSLTGQQQFATGALAPWSVIVVDNTWHLLTLYLIALAAGAK